MLAVWKQRGKVVGHSLPLLLFGAILLWSREIWEVSSNTDFLTYLILILLFAVMGSIYVWRGSRDMCVVLLDEFAIWKWKTVETTLAKYKEDIKGSKISSFDPCLPLDKYWVKRIHYKPNYLCKSKRINIRMKLFIHLAAISLLGGLVTGIFFFILGGITIDNDLRDSWIHTSASSLNIGMSFKQGIVENGELLEVTGIIAILSSLRFAVKLLTEDTYQKYFLDELKNEINIALAIHEAHLSLP